MNALNSIILEGTVEEMDYKLSNGTSTAVVNMAVERKYKDKDGNESLETSYFEVEAYGKMAISVGNFAKKGSGIRVVGRLKQRRWEENGRLCSKVIVIAEHIEYRHVVKKEEAKNGN